MWWGLSRRTRRWQERIQELDPERDAFAIVDMLATREFPLDMLVATEIAQLRTFTIPSISRILHRTRQYEDHGQRRLDDTKAMLVEITTEGVQSERAQRMIRHLNAIHSLYPITNDDYLYTLSTFVFDPWLWLQRYGWRELTQREAHALYVYYRGMGEAMHIQDIPPSFEAFWEWRVTYEARTQRYHDDNHHVAQGLLRAVKAQLPRILRPWMTPVLTALIDKPRFLASLGLSTPSPWLRHAVQALMRLRALALRFVTFWDLQNFREWWFFQHYPSHPDGYRPEDLGPPHLVERMRRQGHCPYHAT